jgi:LacI family transcriptional regulator
LKALSDLGLNTDESLVINNNLTREQGINAVQKLLNLPEKPDAIFCANDTTAQSVIFHLIKTGYKVPDDIAVVGFSNEPFSEMVTPSISTVMQPGFLIGTKSADLLIEQILNKQKEIEFQIIVMPTDLIIRDSSARHK